MSRAYGICYDNKCRREVIPMANLVVKSGAIDYVAKGNSTTITLDDLDYTKYAVLDVRYRCGSSSNWKGAQCHKISDGFYSSTNVLNGKYEITSSGALKVTFYNESSNSTDMDYEIVLLKVRGD